MPDSRIAVFIGSKGGAGTTTLCRELARTLREDGNIALVDADLTGRRSIALLFDIVRSLDTARQHFADLERALRRRNRRRAGRAIRRGVRR